MAEPKAASDARTPEREWSYMDRQTGLTGDDVDDQGRLTYTTETPAASDAAAVRDLLYAGHDVTEHDGMYGCTCGAPLTREVTQVDAAFMEHLHKQGESDVRA